ncbi:MAG TPA: hypothetical protein VJ851_01650 [Jatrophihabitans sp.]|nr:hypothetical protein [Jatrophihabitans sp.]
MTGRTTAAGPEQVKLRRLPLSVLLGGMLLAGLCALLALNTASAAQELTQRALTDSNASASDVEQQLVRDLAAKQAPAALASAAVAQGLVPNPNPAFLRINADGSVTVLGSPTPASLPAQPSTPTPSHAAAGPDRSPSSTPGRSTSASRPSVVVTVTVTRTASTGASGRPSPKPTVTSSAPGRH